MNQTLAKRNHHPPARPIIATRLILPPLLLLFSACASHHALAFSSQPRVAVAARRGEISSWSSSWSTRSDHPSDPAAAATNGGGAAAATTHIVFPGGGIFFYWYAGAVEFLRESGYDLTACSFCGASAGALAATLASLDVDFYLATDLALDMAADAGVWDRSGGLQGIWGPLIEEWLDELLPRCIQPVQGRVTLLLTTVPSFGKTKISNFIDREDLIRANLASVHIPWFLDGNLTTDFRNQPHIDGSFLSKPTDYVPHKVDETRKPRIIVLDWKNDPYMREKRGLDFVEALSDAGIRELLERGKSYAKVMEEEGQFETLRKK